MKCQPPLLDDSILSIGIFSVFVLTALQGIKLEADQPNIFNEAASYINGSLSYLQSRSPYDVTINVEANGYVDEIVIPREVSQYRICVNKALQQAIFVESSRRLPIEDAIEGNLTNWTQVVRIIKVEHGKIFCQANGRVQSRSDVKNMYEAIDLLHAPLIDGLGLRDFSRAKHINSSNDLQFIGPFNNAVSSSIVAGNLDNVFVKRLEVHSAPSPTVLGDTQRVYRWYFDILTLHPLLFELYQCDPAGKPGLKLEASQTTWEEVEPYGEVPVSIHDFNLLIVHPHEASETSPKREIKLGETHRDVSLRWNEYDPKQLEAFNKDTFSAIEIKEFLK